MSDFDPQATATPEPLPSPRRRWQTPVAFAFGLALAGGVSLSIFQTGASANITPAAPPTLAVPPDPRLERLLSLTESQRDCDSACLGDLRLKADKAAALEQALGNVQTSAAESGQRAAALEAEKKDLEAQNAQHLAELGEEHKRQLDAWEKEKAGLAAQMEKQKAELEDAHKKQLAALEQRLGQSEPKPKTPGQATARSVPAKLAQPAQPPALAEKPPQKPEPVRVQNPARPPAGEDKSWTVLGMTASTVVVSSPAHRVVALAAGESLDGLTVHRIDLDGGLAETNLGRLVYKK